MHSMWYNSCTCTVMWSKTGSSFTVGCNCSEKVGKNARIRIKKQKEMKNVIWHIYQITFVVHVRRVPSTAATSRSLIVKAILSTCMCASTMHTGSPPLCQNADPGISFCGSGGTHREENQGEYWLSTLIQQPQPACSWFPPTAWCTTSGLWTFKLVTADDYSAVHCVFKSHPPL